MRAASAIETCEEERRFGAPPLKLETIDDEHFAAHNNNNLFSLSF
jgi:hypothetical protein